MASLARTTLRGFRRRFRGWLSERPSLYLPLVGNRRAFDGSRKAVGKHTEVVMEGFPRCGNSFAFAAFRLAQDRHVEIAHHLHASAQVVAGVRQGLPTLVLIRRPDDAVVSLLIRATSWSPAEAYAEYVRFYSNVLSYKRAIVVAAFEDVVDDFGGVTRKLNDKFGTSFAEFEHNEDNVERAFAYLDGVSTINGSPSGDLERSVGRPSANRDQLKITYRERIEAPSLASLRQRAQEIYEALVSEEEAA